MPAKLKYPQLANKDWLENKYLVEHLSTVQIAQLVGGSVGAVSDWMKRHNIKARSIKDSLVARYPSGRSGNQAANWRGGRQIINGYAWMYIFNHPHAPKNRIQVHRLVMEKELGRYLKSDEVVHHIDGDKQNNALSNLVLKTRGEHVSDHFKAGHEVLHLRQQVKDLEATIDNIRKELAEC